MIEVLFVCTGNICRSPTAEGVFRGMAARARIGERVGADSAGIIAYHAGEPPDERARAAAARRGYDLAGQTARQIAPCDFGAFDYVIALDRAHHSQLLALKPTDAPARLRLLLEYAPALSTLDVPDPYYGGAADFERTMYMIEAAAAGLLETIRAEHL